MVPNDASGKPCVWWDGATADPVQVAKIIQGMDSVHAFIVARAKSYLINHGDLKTWHRKIFEEVVPVNYYAGHYRSRDVQRPCLAWDVQCTGVLGPVNGLSFTQVSLAMEGLSDQFQNACLQISSYLTSSPPPRERNRQVVRLLALAVGEFIRIHPFVNGNGRISRLFANYICQRFDMPLAFSVPSERPILAAYEDAHALAMRGQHDALYVFFLQALSVSSR